MKIVVTGAFSGIGKACVEYFRSKGDEVFALDIVSQAEYRVDVSSALDIENFVANLKTSKIKIDVLVNNAAIQIEKKLLETTEKEWDQVLNTNLKSVFLMTKLLYPCFSSPASIVNISSVHAKTTSKSLASYVASKGAISSLTRSMALELADFGIRVNAVLPGAVDTPMLHKGLSRNSLIEDAKKKLIDATPLKRIADPLDIASLVYFLANPEFSKNITGQEFLCDGGVSAKLASE